MGSIDPAFGVSGFRASGRSRTDNDSNLTIGKDTILLWDVWFRSAPGALRAEFHNSSFQGLLIAKQDLVSVERDSATVERNGAKP